jgi:acyl-CoA reductase-like NAD-dependent aldehyde dehydrogenase
MNRQDPPPGTFNLHREGFASLISIIPFDDFQGAISAANATLYGLCAAVSTCNIDHALVTAQSPRFGCIHCMGLPAPALTTRRSANDRRTSHYA